MPLTCAGSGGPSRRVPRKTRRMMRSGSRTRGHLVRPSHLASTQKLHLALPRHRHLSTRPQRQLDCFRPCRFRFLLPTLSIVHRSSPPGNKKRLKFRSCPGSLSSQPFFLAPSVRVAAVWDQSKPRWLGQGAPLLIHPASTNPFQLPSRLTTKKKAGLKSKAMRCLLVPRRNLITQQRKFRASLATTTRTRPKEKHLWERTKTKEGPESKNPHPSQYPQRKWGNLLRWARSTNAAFHQSHLARK
mmetsp:Transcript_22750/g.51303  ORF Transcript_22750/g.51303 Transcript_22750/m.51303 type:complete len:244 (-) Transcript_22750:147-878(-)